MKLTSIELLPWDSDFFSCNIARVNSEKKPNSEKLLDIAIEECEKAEVECLYFLTDASQQESIRTAIGLGFELMDIKVTLTLKLPHSLELAHISIRPFQTQDLKSIQAIAQSSFTNTRFSLDKHFKSGKAAEMYQIWATNSAHSKDKLVLVAEENAKILGFVCCGHNATTSSIDLIGVDSQARGKGVGSALISAASHYFSNRSMTEMTVVTQGRNIPAQVLYQKNGFTTSKVELWFHKWFSKRLRVAA